MRSYTHYLKTIIGLFFLFNCLQAAKANHFVGSHIGYRAIDSIRYEIILTMYRDCASIPLSSVPVTVTGKSSGPFTINPQQVSSADVTGSFAGCTTTSRCSGSFTYGFEMMVFKDTVNVSGGACTYTFSITVNSRSSGITTGAANTVHYNYATLNKCAGINNSPLVYANPAFLLYTGADANIAPTITEFIDKEDSIAYQLGFPLDASGAAIAYGGNAPYSYLSAPNKNVALPGGFHINNQTGEISFRPTKQNEVTVYVVESKEYRKVGGTDVEIGTTRLEVLSIVLPNPGNKFPEIKGGNIVVCAGQQGCNTITTNDGDKSDSTFIFWNSPLPGGSLTTTGSNGIATGSFCWTPANANIRRSPHLYTVAVRDNYCTPNAVTMKSFLVDVKRTYDTSNHWVVSKTVSCNRVAVKAGKDNFAELGLDWKAESGTLDMQSADSAVIYFSKPGWNRFAIRSKTFPFGCVGPYEWDSVFITPLYSIVLSKTKDTVKCGADSVLLQVSPATGTAPFKYQWDNSPWQTNTSVYAKNMATAYFKIRVFDSLGCFTEDSIRVAASSPMADIGNDTTVCRYTIVKLEAANPTGIAPFKYEWLGIDTTPSITIKINDSAAYQLKISDSTGCFNIVQQSVGVFKFSLKLGNDTIICAGMPVTITAEAFNGKAPLTFPWPAISATKASYTYTPAADSVFAVSITDGRGCKAYDTMKIISNPPVNISLPATAAACEGDSIHIIPTVSGGTVPYVYSWNGVPGGNTYRLKANPNVTKITLDIMDNVLCAATAKTTTITTYALPVANAGADITACYGAKASLKAIATQGTGPYSFVWLQGPATDTFSITTYVSNTFKVNVTDANGCKDDDEVIVTARPRDFATLTVPMGLCANEQPVGLQATPTNGTWQGSGISGSTFSPAVAGAGSHQLIYSFTGNNNCPFKDTILANVSGNVPVADFSASATTGGKALNVQFLDISTGSPIDWQWTISDNSGTGIHTATTQNTSFNFTVLGKYSVRLIVSNSQCADTIEKKDYINITNVGIGAVVQNAIAIYPNPAKNAVFIAGDNISRVRLFDAQGREVETVLRQNAPAKFELVFGSVSPGIYLLHVGNAANSVVYRLLVE